MPTRLPRIWFLLMALLAVLASWVTTAAQAQGHRGMQASQPNQVDSGEYRILEARYGTEEQNIDVTQRLRELSAGDQSLRISNELIGADPAPGRVKMLRIYARHAQSGRIRTFEYSEGSVIDGNVFLGWRGGSWGDARGDGRADGRGEGRGRESGWGRPGYADGGDGEYRIARAIYGTPERHADVTDRLRELARTDQRFRLGNDTFGGLDPDFGRVKTLRIFATGLRGQQRVFDYGEGSMVDGAQFSGWSGGGWAMPGSPSNAVPGGWAGGGWGQNPNAGVPSLFGQRGLTIVSAVYGNGQRTVDLSTRLRERIAEGRTLNFLVNNRNAGGDPAPGVVKTLTVIYRIDGREQRRVVNEGQTLTLP